MNPIPLRLYLLGGGLAAALIGVAYVNHLRHANADLKVEAKAATVQAETNQASAGISARRAVTVAKVHTKTEEGRHAIDVAPDLDAALADWGTAVDGVRALGHQPVAPADGR